ncbi:MAG: hypothetical protein LBP93_01055 [Treponema sp.]|jgi:hypothetical protein|nr:hypothetical protein [Treponema sp.]
MLVLKENEEDLIGEVLSYLDAKYPEDGALVRHRFDCLRELGRVISRFPSVRDTQIVRGKVRTEEKLIESLSTFTPSSRLLHIPTRIVAARSFLVAKSHAFSLLSILVRDTDIFYVPVRNVIFSIICTLMAEEVYFSCLDDPSFSEKTKSRLAADLISLWDSGTDPRSVQHLPALEALWTARDEAPPTFGTMDGFSELMRISLDLGEDWHDFLVAHISDDETRWALEEFLFGLSFEEIVEVRSRLKDSGISAVSAGEVRSYLGREPVYTIVKDPDPRAIYDFYVDRRDAAAFRKRISAPGPLRTLEEIYLKYRIAQE